MTTEVYSFTIFVFTAELFKNKKIELVDTSTVVIFSS